MKGITAFTCISDVDESLIAESLSIFESPYVAAIKAYRSERRRAFFQSPLWAAMICAVVSLSILSAIVMAGNGVFTPPANTTPPEITATETDTEEPTEPETERRPASTYHSDWQVGTPVDPTPQPPTVPEVTIDWNGFLPGYGSPPTIDIEPTVPRPNIPGQNNSSGPIRNPNLNPNPGFP